MVVCKIIPSTVFSVLGVLGINELERLSVTSVLFCMQLFRMSTKKSDEEWKCVLNAEQYRVARLKGTEAPFTGQYYHNKEKGEYLCVCCGSKLFDSSAKFDSGSGWPSFYQVYGSNGRDDSQTNVTRTEDNSLDSMRIEISCKQCGAHLGHVFEDGPKPTGLRYCVNSASLSFKKSE